MRKFLVVLDDTPECLVAMRFAAIRASKTGGGVELLGIVSPEEFQHWIGVGEMMRAEAREKIEAHFEVFRERMEKVEGIRPTLAIREGEKAREIIEHIKADPEIGVLVLGAGTKGDGPGPLVTELTGRRIGEMPVPITVVPGNMTKEDIIAVS
ncbi:universal stress protein [Halovulum dunhuangense]|uniref:Universal stress protein n=1 Tax=Halovulum dunhuangense TaxID=1505036 RepID=A0A849KWZ6_9RHOB|nr:universal stress protein [Halovulum dunhuangense]NNU78897.1 universal stress protein [Halovulum dunhuangense]